jgi:hypothetical protein
MDNFLIDSYEANSITPIIVEICVRINWHQFLSWYKDQPEESIRSFYSLILSIFARCIQRSSNYAVFQFTLKFVYSKAKFVEIAGFDNKSVVFSWRVSLVLRQHHNH